MPSPLPGGHCSCWLAAIGLLLSASSCLAQHPDAPGTAVPPVAAPVPTSARGTISLSFGRGPVVASDRLREIYSPGTNVRAGYARPVANGLELGGTVEVQSFGFREDGFLRYFGYQPGDITAEGGELRMQSLNLSFAMARERAGGLVVYLYGGPGIVRYDYSRISYRYRDGRAFEEAARTENELSFALGLGSRIPLGRHLGVLAEASYFVGVMGRDAGGSLQMAPVRLGLTYRP